MEEEEMIDLNIILISLRQAIEKVEDIEQELKQNKITNYTVRTENYTGIMTIVENK